MPMCAQKDWSEPHRGPMPMCAQKDWSEPQRLAPDRTARPFSQDEPTQLWSGQTLSALARHQGLG